MATKKKQSKGKSKKAPAKKAAPKKTKAPKKDAAPKKLSGMDAAVKVLGESKEPLSSKEMVERMLAKGYWQTQGKTPAATIYAAILRHIQKHGAESRFRKVDRGKFQLAQ